MNSIHCKLEASASNQLKIKVAPPHTPPCVPLFKTLCLQCEPVAFLKNEIKFKSFKKKQNKIKYIYRWSAGGQMHSRWGWWGGLVLAEAGSGWNLIQAELSDVFVSAEFQHILSLLSSAVRKRVCFLSACLSITQFIFTPSPNPPPNLPQNEGHFSFSAPFITPRRESVSKSVYMTDTGSETLDFFRRPTTSVEICGDVKKKKYTCLTSTSSGAPTGQPSKYRKSAFFLLLFRLSSLFRLKYESWFKQCCASATTCIFYSSSNRIKSCYIREMKVCILHPDSVRRTVLNLIHEGAQATCLGHFCLFVAKQLHTAVILSK